MSGDGDFQKLFTRDTEDLGLKYCKTLARDLAGVAGDMAGVAGDLGGVAGDMAGVARDLANP